jgi:glycerol kinase
MQFQADISGKKVLRPEIIESTALGAAMLAGIKAGVWKNADEPAKIKKYERTFEPQMSENERKRLIDGWKHALRQVMTR